MSERISKGNSLRDAKLVVQEESIPQDVYTMGSKFISENGLVIYGGTAIWFTLKSLGYDSSDVFPPGTAIDLDCYSSTPWEHAKSIARSIKLLGKEQVAGREILSTAVAESSRLHIGTFRVKVNGIPVIDISYAPHPILQELRTGATRYIHNGFNILLMNPDMLISNIYLELSDVTGLTWRWEKLVLRLNSLWNALNYHNKTTRIPSVDYSSIPQWALNLCRGSQGFILDDSSAASYETSSAISDDTIYFIAEDPEIHIGKVRGIVQNVATVTKTTRDQDGITPYVWLFKNSNGDVVCELRMPGICVPYHTDDNGVRVVQQEVLLQRAYMYLGFPGMSPLDNNEWLGLMSRIYERDTKEFVNCEGGVTTLFMLKSQRLDYIRKVEMGIYTECGNEFPCKYPCIHSEGRCMKMAEEDRYNPDL